MPVAVLTLLKLCLVALIFLFIARVVRAVWTEIGEAPHDSSLDGRLGVSTSGSAANVQTQSSAFETQKETQRHDPRKQKRKNRRQRATNSIDLVVTEPVEHRGDRYPLDVEMTIGRAPGCAIVVGDSFASQLHARVFERNGEWFVEDLGSRNGTWLNRTQVHGPSKLEPGDLLKIGDTVLEVRK